MNNKDNRGGKPQVKKEIRLNYLIMLKEDSYSFLVLIFLQCNDST